MSPEQIYEKYKGRIQAVMDGLRKALVEAGHDCEEPSDESIDEYRWSMVVDGNVDVTFTIAESEEYDGEEGGVNFMVDVVEEGGRPLGGLCPYNYTDKVWVSRGDDAAVEERFIILEKADPADIVTCVERSKAT